MRRIAALLLTASSLAIASASAVEAADLRVYAPPPPAPVPVLYEYNWTGLYVGGHLGGLWGHKTWTEVVGPSMGAVIHPDPDGLLAGGQLGFNYQLGSFVYGVEASLSWTNAEGRSACLTLVGFGCNVDLDWMATLTGRVGWALGRALFYGTGGIAWVRDNYHFNAGSPAQIDVTSTRPGWLVGVGFEYAFAPSWSAKLEYNYIGFGSEKILFAPGLVEEIGQNAHILKGAVNYRFGWPGAGPVIARY
jgi:outer membrane immunogenic protein